MASQIKTPKSLIVREPYKPAKPKVKRRLDNSSLKPFFGKSPENSWDKDIYTGNNNICF